MYITQMASRDAELADILIDFKKVHFQEVFELDDVIMKIDAIRNENNVAMCKKLDKAIMKQ